MEDIGHAIVVPMDSSPVARRFLRPFTGELLSAGQPRGRARLTVAVDQTGVSGSPEQWLRAVFFLSRKRVRASRILVLGEREHDVD